MVRRDWFAKTEEMITRYVQIPTAADIKAAGLGQDEDTEYVSVLHEESEAKAREEDNTRALEDGHYSKLDKTNSNGNIGSPGKRDDHYSSFALSAQKKTPTSPPGSYSRLVHCVCSFLPHRSRVRMPAR